MARRCIFCGGEPVTKEHVVAQWISNVLVPRGATIHIESVGTQDGNTTQSERSASSIIDLQAKRVCGPCNYGWMSNLEHRAQPTLTAMFHGKRTVLTPSDQLLLATWATKTAIALQYLDKRGREPSWQHRRWIAANASPPPGVAVCLGAYSGEKLMRCLMKNQYLPWAPGDLGDRDNPAIHWITFNLGQLVIQTLFITTSLEIDVRIPLEYEAYLAPIWPNRDRDVVWPPPSILDDAEFDSFANMGLT